ncbi:alpha/beta hydrolase-fold protein [Marinoscillum sp.]|uniref:alpha/beta hydrolase-fold protein n=1 Tax=Marinoscillum sp. TaxID=2024838 RepID=UPI003BA8660E
MTRMDRYSARLPLMLMVLIFVQSLFGCKDEAIKVDEPIPFSRLLENQKMSSQIFKVDINYAVLLPEDYNESTEDYPVVYLLHGFGDNETAWYTSGSIKYYSDLYKDEIVPMIYVMPIGYNTYYVNRYTGSYPYMDMITTELVPTIDSLFRTKQDKVARAVMGYSMGGYGALILPALNPDIFTIGVPLSMSFRTDEQYISEPQGVFDYQWGTIFGGKGASGEARLTDYFKQHSPFHFFNTSNKEGFAGLKFLIDCGDDEETLTITNDALHALMRDHQIPHEYRVRSGGHSFDYWKKSYPEALKFISNSVQGIPHPTNPEPVTIGERVISSDFESVEISGVEINVLIPADYATSTIDYPVVYMIHDYEEGQRESNVTDIFSLLRNGMAAGTLKNGMVVEIPVSESIESDRIAEIISYVEAQYRALADRASRVLLGNALGGLYAANIASEGSSLFGSCFLFDAELQEDGVDPQADIFYYLDISDDGDSYRGYHDFYVKIRDTDIGYEYRVRQGEESYQSFLNGLSESFTSLKQSLKN